MDISVFEDDNDEIEEFAKQLFKRDYPDRVWGIQPIGQSTGNVRGVITAREKQKYLKLAKGKISAQRD